MPNFDGVNEASERAMTQPGTIDIFKIAKIEFSQTKNNLKDYMKTTFENKDTGFIHNFFMTNEQTLSRIQSLAKACTGGPLKGEVTNPQLKALFVGKTVALKVTGRVGDNGKGYPDLSFGGFAKPASQLGELSFTAKEQENIDAAKEAIRAAHITNADNESAPPPTAAGGQTEAVDEGKVF